MAGDWIKMRNDLAEDPAVIAIAGALDVEEDLVVGKLHRLWSWADRQSRDGHADSVTEKWIDRYVQRDGFARAMLKAGWLSITETGISFPNFDRHNGKSAKTRALATDRQRNARVTPPSRSQRDKSVTREEKRRSKKPPVSPLTLPAGVEEQRWAAFREHRKKLRKPMTAYAEQRALDTLVGLVGQGYDAAKLIDAAIERGWQTFYPRDDCRAPGAQLAGPKQGKCLCGAGGTVMVGGQWRCNDHVRGFEAAA